jgi:hypothetical protein
MDSTLQPFVTYSFTRLPCMAAAPQTRWVVMAIV